MRPSKNANQGKVAASQLARLPNLDGEGVALANHALPHRLLLADEREVGRHRSHHRRYSVPRSINRRETMDRQFSIFGEMLGQISKTTLANGL